MSYRCETEVKLMHRFVQWFFRSRETGAITIAQAPNLVLWVVIAAGVLIQVFPSEGKWSVCFGDCVQRRFADLGPR
jgi:hypothetical protein